MAPALPEGTGEYGKVRAPLDQAAVDNYCTQNVKGFKAPSVIQQFSFGQSNPTYFVTDANGFKYVLRKKPSGKLVSNTAHAIEREYKIIDMVSKTGKVPVPKVYSLCTDESILGTPFYMMEYLEGRIFTDVRMPEIESREERFACWKSIIKTLAALHSLKPSEIGLGDYGSTKPFYPRQIRSLTKISHAQAAIVDHKTGKPVGTLPALDFLLEWYNTHLPGTGRGEPDDSARYEGGIVHGDFKCDNMIFHPTKPEVIGVLDWELSTLGHPYSDLANLLQPFYVPVHDDPEMAKNQMILPLRDISPQDLPIPGAIELMKDYCQASGMKYPLEKWVGCTSFAFFRLAVITQGIAARAAVGQASSAQAGKYAKIYVSVEALAVETILRGEKA